MRQNRSVHRALIYKVYGLSGQIIHSVRVLLFLLQNNLRSRFLHIQNRFKQNPRAVLDKLAHGMQIRRQIHSRRENSLLILALAFTIKLLPPLGNIMEAGLIVGHDLDLLSLPQQNIAHRRIHKRGILLIFRFQRLLSGRRGALHQPVDVRTAYRDRQKSYSRQDGEPSSYIIRHHKGLIALFIGQIFKRSLRLIRGCIDPLIGLFPAILADQHFLEHTECDGRLRCRAGLGNNIDGKILALQNILEILDIFTADAVSYKINFRRFSGPLRKHIVKAVRQKFDGRPSSQIRAADSDH